MRSVLNRFGLAKAAFTKELDADDLFAAPSHLEAILRLKTAIEMRASATLVGDSGVGKTCVLRALQRDLNPARFRVTYLHHANVSPRDFYRQLSMVLGLEPKAHPSAMFRQIQKHVEDLADEQKIYPVIFLDEAQLMPFSMLEQLHLLLNFRMDSRAFLSVVLVGLPELKERLGRNILESLSTRLPTRVQLEPLKVEDIGGYLRHRMKVAGCAQDVFSEDAVLAIREASGGILRKVDLLVAAGANPRESDHPPAGLRVAQALSPSRAKTACSGKVSPSRRPAGG
jgi:type II secretory pathway predicted ATPase ExeA